MKLKCLSTSILLLIALTAQAKSITDRPKSRVGLSFQSGIGFQNINMLTLQDGGNSTISFGGGSGGSLSLGREFSPHFDLSASIGIFVSLLEPIVQNADVTFTTSRFSITPAYIIPIKQGNRTRFKVGAGLDLSWANKLELQTENLRDGFNDTWTYDRAIGYHVNVKFEVTASRHWMFTAGLQYNGMQYKFIPSGSRYPLDSDLQSPDGGAINLIIGANYCF